MCNLSIVLCVDKSLVGIKIYFIWRNTYMNNERIWFFGDYDYSPILDMLQIKEIKTCVVYSFYNKKARV